MSASDERGEVGAKFKAMKRGKKKEKEKTQIKLTQHSLHVPFQLHERIRRLVVRAAPRRWRPNTIHNVVNHDASDEARFRVFVAQVVLEVRRRLGARQRVVRRQQDGPEPRRAHLHRRRVLGLARVALDKRPDHGVKVHDTLMPGRHRPLIHVHHRCDKRRRRRRRDQAATATAIHHDGGVVVVTDGIAAAVSD